MRTYRLIAIVGALTLLAAACQAAPPPDVQTAPTTADLPPQTETTAPAQEARAQTPFSAPDASIEPEPVAPIQVRQELVATNPATVTLANGSPTLVEFFAYW